MLCKVDSRTDGTFKLKCVSVILGILVVILATVGSCGEQKDICFLVTVLITLTFSLLHLICALLDVFKANYTSRVMEFLFHLIGGIAVMVVSIVILTSTDATTSCNVMEKTSAATIGILNGFIYLYICRLILQIIRKKASSQEPVSLPLYIFCGVSRAPAVFSCGEGETRKLSLSSSCGPKNVGKSGDNETSKGDEDEEKRSMLKA